MSSFDGLLERAKKNYSDSFSRNFNEPRSGSTQAAVSAPQRTVTTSSFDGLFERAKANYADSFRSEEQRSTVVDWMDRYNRVMQGVSAYDKKRNGGYTQDASGGFGTEIDSLIADFDNIKGYAADYGFMNSGNYLDQLKQLQNSIQGINDNFSQFEDEDAYNRYMEYWKDQEEKKNLDLDAYSREIAALEQQLEDYDPQIDWTDTNQRKQYDADLKELEDEINRRKQYLAQAQRIQKKDDFSAVANPESEKYDAAFDSKSGYVSTEQDGKLQRMMSQYSMGYDDLTYEYINNQNGIRDEIKHKTRAYSKDETSFEKKGYDYMTEDEVGLYNYYYSMGGKASAEAYLDTIQEDLNQRKAAGMYQQMEGKTGAEMVFGVEAGLDQFKSGIKGAVRAVKGDDSYVAPSATQYASGMVREDLADDGFKLPAWLGGASLGQVGYDAITTTANMAPSIIGSVASNFIVPGSGAAVGSALLGGSAAGNAYQEALNEGYTVDQARGYGILSGASEIIMERLLGGISAYGGNALGKFFTQNMKNADTALKQIAKKIGGSMLSEFSEEYLQEVLTPVFKNLTLGTDEEVKLVSAEALYAGFLGAITGGVMEGPQAIMKGRNATQLANNATPELSNATKTVDNTTEPFDNATPALEKSTPGGATEESSAAANKMSATESTVTKSSGKNESSPVKVGVSKMETVQQTADIESFAEQFGTQAEAVRRNYLQGQQEHEAENLQEYQVGFQVAFAIGLEGGKEEALDNVPYLSQSQREIAFSLGKDAAAAQKAAETKTSTAKAPTTKASLGQTAQLVAEDGSNGGTVTIAEIVSMDDSGMTLRLEDGRTVTDEDLDFPEGAEVYSAVMELGMDAESANAIVKAGATASIPRAAVAEGIETAYHYGRYGYGMDALLKAKEAAEIPESILQASYQAGEKRRQQNRETAQAEENRATSKATAPERRGKVHFHGESDALNDVQKESLQGLEWIADLTGAQIHVEDMGDSEGLSRVNGLYDPADDSIHIDLRAGSDGTGTLLYTAAHEFVHRMRRNNEAAFYRLADFLVEQYGKKGISTDALVKQQMADAAADGIELNYDEAFEEMVADAMEAMFTDTDALTKMEKLKTQDRRLWQEIKDFVLGLAEKIKAAYARLKPDSAEARYVLQMKESIDQFAQLFAEGIMDSGAEKNTDQKDGEKIRYSVRSSFAKELQEWFDTTSHDERKVSGKRFLVGTTTDVLKSIGVKDYEIYFGGSKIDKILTGNTSMTLDTIKQAVQLLEDPILIMQSRTVEDSIVLFGEVYTDGDKPVMISVLLNPKTRSGEILDYAVITSAYGRRSGNVQNLINNSTIYYVNENKNRTEKWLQALGLQLPSAITKFGSITSIRNSKLEVNKKFSMRDSDGTNLTEEQAEYFRDSKVRDTEGNLLVVYHGTKAGGFNIFKYDKAVQTGTDYGEAFYFTSDREKAGGYSYDVTKDKRVAQYRKERDALKERFLQTRSEADKNAFLSYKLDGKDLHDMINDEGYQTEGSEVKKVYLNLKNPLIADAGGKYYYEVYTDYFDQARKNGNDGIIVSNVIDNPRGEARPIDTYIAFRPEQIKNTDNLNPTDDPDIRYSTRKKQPDLEVQNKKLEEDVDRLRELVKLQGKVTHGKIMKPSSVEDAARYLKKLFHTKSDSDTKELTGLLKGFYEYIAGDPELTWEGVREQAAPIVEWLQDNEKFRRDQYAQDVLDTLKGQTFRLDETQLGEVNSQYGNLKAYRKAVKNMASSKAAQSLDQLWHELSTQYPDIFSPDTSASDMPIAFAETVERLEGLESTETAMDWRMKDQAMLEAVYDSYWKLSGLETVADKYSKKIFEIRGKHYEKMTELRKDRDQKLKELQESKKQSVKTVRDNRDKAAEKKKIRKTISKLNKLLTHGNKKQHIKKGMEDFAATALASAEILFTDNISNEDMILNGIGTQVDARENRLIEEVRVLLQKRKDLYNLDTATQEVEDIVFTGESENYEQRMAESEKLDRKISGQMRQLKGVFERERKRLNEATVSGILEDLAEAYRGLGSSDALYIRAATDERVYQHLKQLKDTIGGITVRDMSVAQLKAVSDAYTMVLTTIRNANKAFTDGRSIQSEAEQMVSEFQSRKIPKKATGIAAKKIIDSIGWNYEKFHYALDRIGSPALTNLFGKLADSENVTMRDVQEAKAYQKEMIEKYHYNDWKIDQKIDRDFVDNTGKEFRLTLAELMALYAYSRRDGADRHIEYGGFKLGKAALTDPKPATTYKLTAEQLAKITGILTDEQRAFAEAMQKYLSETMGAKGNEVSMKLYGIEMFKEENYFPLHIAGEFKAQAQESQVKAAAGFQTMSNAGFTQARNKESTAPIVLEDFMSVWADHVNEMSRYHGAVPALEDIRRVMNYSVYSDADSESVSVEAAMTNAFGKQAVQYFDNLYREANSGAIADKLDAAPKKMLSLFRKNAVAYSVSVWIQQPASIYRARMMVDRKYFGRHGFFTLTGGMLRILNRKKWNAAYEEMMRYAPGVTMAKEIGGFDTSTGNSIRSYLMDTEKSFAQSMKNDTAKNKVKSVLNLVDDNTIANLPNVMDKVAWIEMWEACKRETVAKNPKMDTDSDAFLEKVGQRFTEVIRGTQVYDSMFAKSPMLKTNNLIVQSAVSFMNEPNTVANMAEAAIRDLTRGNKKQAAKTAAALVTSIVVNELLKSIVYAMRDDDEDETLLEKYISAVAGSLIDDVTVFNYVPFARDVWSVWQGYDAERADMAILSDAANAVKKLAQLSGEDAASMTEDELVKWNEEVTDASWAVAETLSPLFGIPLKNIRRDILAVFNAVKIQGLDKNRQSTALSIRHTVEDAIWQGSKSGTDRLYEAMAAGDAAYVQRLRDNYKSDSAWQTAVRKGLRDHDSRIWEAAVAWNTDDLNTYIRIAKEIRSENRFDQDDIVLAIRAEASSMAEKDGSSASTVKGYFTNEKFGVAMGQNNVSMADTIRKDLIDTAVANGKTREEAEESVRSTARTQLKQLYANGTITGANAEKMLVKYGGYDLKDAADKVAEWKYEKDFPELDGRITYAQYKRWETDGKSRGIGLDTFTDVVEYRGGNTSAGVRSQEDVAAYINRMPISTAQKDALWCCFWSESTLYKNAPWH